MSCFSWSPAFQPAECPISEGLLDAGRLGVLILKVTFIPASLIFGSSRSPGIVLRQAKVFFVHKEPMFDEGVNSIDVYRQMQTWKLGCFLSLNKVKR